MRGWLVVAVVVTTIAALVTVAEWVDPMDAPTARLPRPTRSDLAWFAVYLLWAPLAGRAVLALADLVSRHSPLHAVVSPWPAAARLALALVVADGAAYWCHRAMHASPVLWRFHAVHHRPHELHWWSAFRFHPLDGFVAHAVPVTLAAALGLGPATIAAYLAVVLVVTVFAHADVWLPASVAAIVATPRFHRMHHATGHDDTNFALVLPVFDRIFGTLGQRRTSSPIVSDTTLAIVLNTQAASQPTSP